MVVDAFIYMFFVGSGTAAGVSAVGLISWKIVNRSINKQPKKKRGIV
jgi:hypothetical protein